MRPKPRAAARVLVTCGPTWAAIDDVRVISNISSGEMGHLVAQAFRGAKVTLIEGPVTDCFQAAGIRVVKYRFFDELAAVLRKELSRGCDVVVHAAAVSDFKVRGVAGRKLASDKGLTLDLLPAPKLIDSIKRLNPGCFLVGFKLEPNLTLRNIASAVRPLFEGPECDLVVANTFKQGWRGWIMDKRGKVLKTSGNKRDIARALSKIVAL